MITALLRRRSVRSLAMLQTHVGKESNKPEEVEAGIQHDSDEIWTKYHDPERVPWRSIVLPILSQMEPRELVNATGLTERALRDIRAGRAIPRAPHQAALIQAAGDYGRAHLSSHKLPTPLDDLAAGATCVEVTRDAG